MELQKHLQAAIPEPVTILGKRLKDFCLGHVRCMVRHGCGYASEVETNIGLNDLLLALTICSMDGDDFNTCYADNSIEVSAKWYHFFLWSSPFKRRIPLYEVPPRNKWLKLYRHYFPKSYLGKWGKQIRAQIKNDSDFNLFQKFDLFEQYRKAATVMPRVWNKSTTKGSNSNANASGHWSDTVINTLRAKCGYTIKDALTVPLAQAFYDFHLFLEQQGAIEFISDDQWEYMQQIKAKEAGKCQT